MLIVATSSCFIRHACQTCLRLACLDQTLAQPAQPLAETAIASMTSRTLRLRQSGTTINAAESGLS
jgi:hypothetical protein